MKSIELLLLEALLIDISRVLNTSIEQDMMYIMSRVKHEGYSFLGITLPTFAKDFERSLEQGYVSPDLFRSFRKLKYRPLIPKFLSGITAHVFDDEGSVRKDASIDAIAGIRQICLVFNKPKMECSDDRKEKSIQSFVLCERDLRSFRPQVWPYLNDFVRISRMCFGDSFSRLELSLIDGSLTPKHGPGAVVESLSSNGKYHYSGWNRRLERSFPYDLYKVPSWSFLDDVRESSEFEDDKDVKVIFVPKTLKTPRVIAIESTNFQYCQQALSRELVALLEIGQLTKGRVNFTSSDRNRELARTSSMDRKYATLDMSEASDRIHAGLAYHLFSGFPRLQKAAFSCRSKYATLPNGMRIPLVKFASMGSAMCFPVESMYHYILCILGGLKAESLPCNYRSVRRVSRHISIFGDDLIVPVTWRVHVEDMLSSVRCVINKRKSFSSGYFRESCGMDAYDGHDVTPSYIRTTPPRQRGDAEGILSFVASANLLYKKGYWTACRVLRDYIEGLLGPLPHVRETSPVIGWFSFLGSYSVERWNKSLMRFEVCSFMVKPKMRKDPIDGPARLLKFFLNRSDKPIDVERELSVRRFSPTLRRRWSIGT